MDEELAPRQAAVYNGPPSVMAFQSCWPLICSYGQENEGTVVGSLRTSLTFSGETRDHGGCEYCGLLVVGLFSPSTFWEFRAVVRHQLTGGGGFLLCFLRSLLDR